MRVVIYYLLLFTVLAIAAWRGGRDERWAAFICVLGTAATASLVAPLPYRYENVEVAVAVIDASVLAGFIAIALRSDRFWPLWVAGIQLTATTGHALKAVHPDLLPVAYGAALAFWSYPILLIIAAGALRRNRILRWRR
jgi:hypothetical protein